RWLELGWTKALEEWSEHLAESNATWVLIQYTALAWSRRGFPMEVPRLFRLAKKQGARRAIVFHDAAAYEGRRFVDRIRRATQLFVMRRLDRKSTRLNSSHGSISYAV